MEKGEGEKNLKIVEDFVDDFINIFLKKLEEHLLHTSIVPIRAGQYSTPPPAPIPSMDWEVLWNGSLVSKTRTELLSWWNLMLAGWGGGGLTVDEGGRGKTYPNSISLHWGDEEISSTRGKLKELFIKGLDVGNIWNLFTVRLN